MGIKYDVVVYTDSSAAKGISNRRGLGKVRHIELNQLWLQDQVAGGKVSVWKIKGEENISDSLTKHSGTERIKQTMRGAMQKLVPGRHGIKRSVVR